MKIRILAVAVSALWACSLAASEPAVASEELRAWEQQQWQTRRTMRGYKAFYEAGYVFTLDDNNCYITNLCGNPPGCNRLSLTTSQGYQFNNFFYLGAGAGMEVNTYRKSKGEEAGVSVPIFADLRFNILNDKKVLPFVVVRAGGSVGYYRGVYMGAQVGIRVKLDKKFHALYAALVTDHIWDARSYIFHNVDGFGFRIGFEY